MRDLTAKPFYGVLKEYEHWIVMFRDKQVTPGSVIIMDKTVKARSLGEVTPQAWSEFGKVSADVESWLKQAFGAEKFNYLALMMFDPEVHFHVIPRYSKPIMVDGKEYVDPDWPKATKRVALELSDHEKATIEAKIKQVVA